MKKNGKGSSTVRKARKTPVAAQAAMPATEQASGAEQPSVAEQAANHISQAGKMVAPTTGQDSVEFCFPLTETASELRRNGLGEAGIRPVALQAVSEVERMRACPHRCQAAVNHRRIRAIAEVVPKT